MSESPFRPRRLLVTGGAGFIGSSFVLSALENTSAYGQTLERVVVLDALTYAGRIENLSSVRDDSRLVFVHGDVCDRPLVSRLFDDHDFDAVMHFAAETHVDRSIADAAPFVRTNVVGTWTLLDVAHQAWRRPGATSLVVRDRRFVHVSSDEVYGTLGPTGRFDETSPYAPRSPYAASKASADLFARAMHTTHGLPVISTHSSNNYGARQSPEKLVARTIACALAREAIPVYGAGDQVREWLYVDDHIEALLRVLQFGLPGQTYDFGGPEEFANRLVVERIADCVDGALGKPPGTSRALVTSVADRPGHDFRYALDSSKARRDLGWEPRVRFDEGVERTVRWYLGNTDWLHAARAALS